MNCIDFEPAMISIQQTFHSSMLISLRDGSERESEIELDSNTDPDGYSYRSAQAATNQSKTTDEVHFISSALLHHSQHRH